MNLPNQPEKLRGYLLSLDHPVGHSKAVFFHALGFTEANSEQLAEALLAIAQSGEVHDRIPTDYGVKYVIAGELSAPSGQAVSLLTVRIIDRGQIAPRFVTAYPLEE